MKVTKWLLTSFQRRREDGLGVFSQSTSIWGLEMENLQTWLSHQKYYVIKNSSGTQDWFLDRSNQHPIDKTVW